MVKLDSRQINEISQELAMSFRVFIHKATGEMISIPNELEMYDIDMEAWEEDIERLDENFTDYLEIEKWSSSWSYDVMVDFVEQHVGNKRVQQRLFNVLNKNKPFRRFKEIVDNEGDYRQMWFNYRDMRQEDFVRRQLDIYDQGDE